MRETLKLQPGCEGALWHYHWRQTFHPPHEHDELEMNLVLRGSLTYLVADRKSDLRAGSMIWLFPDQNHVLTGQSRDLEMWIGVFSPAMLARLSFDTRNRTLLARDPMGKFSRHLQVPRRVELDRLMQEVFGRTREPVMFNAGLAYVLLRAWQTFCDASSEVGGDEIHPSVEAAVRRLCDADPPRTVVELADEVGLCASRLSVLFKREIGLSLSQFRNRRRLEQFWTEYGAGSRVTMLQAALRAGFGSYAQFHRVFRHHMAISPQAYQRKRKMNSVAAGARDRK